MIKTHERLYQSLGYIFREPQLLKAALSHRSLRGANNERLEFLGDAILNFIIAAHLYQQYPTAKEGELSRLRSYLVKGETLAALAQEFDLGSYLHLGTGELKSGGSRRLSTLANALEAIIGAIYLDSDIATCKQCVLAWYQERLENLSLQASEKDPKTQLQEYLQARKMGLPTYHIVSIAGQLHEQIFVVSCKVLGLPFVTEASGSNRRKAEQQAAKKFLEQLKNA